MTNVASLYLRLPCVNPGHLRCAVKLFLHRSAATSLIALDHFHLKFELQRLYTMAENTSASTPSSLPSAPQPAAAAQNQQYDVAQGNGQANSAHMPPPPRPPVIIPQNNNPIPTAMGSPLSANMMSPTSAGGYVRRAAPEPNKRALYVGGLDPRVTEDILKQIFETTGHVVSVKIIPDKNVSVRLVDHGRPTPAPLSRAYQNI